MSDVSSGYSSHGFMTLCEKINYVCKITIIQDAFEMFDVRLYQFNKLIDIKLSYH